VSSLALPSASVRRVDEATSGCTCGSPACPKAHPSRSPSGRQPIVVRGGSPLAYLACPLTVRGEEYRRVREQVREAQPDHELVDPRSLWRSDDAWRRAWPGQLAQLDLLIVAAPDGTIGAGVGRELFDALYHGVKVRVLGPDGLLHQLGDVALTFPTQPTRSVSEGLRIRPLPSSGPVA